MNITIKSVQIEEVEGVKKQIIRWIAEGMPAPGKEEGYLFRIKGKYEMPIDKKESLSDVKNYISANLMRGTRDEVELKEIMMDHSQRPTSYGDTMIKFAINTQRVKGTGRAKLTSLRVTANNPLSNNIEEVALIQWGMML